MQALLTGRSCIDAKVMQQAIDILAIKVPKTYSGGTYLSDFELVSGSEQADTSDVQEGSVTQTVDEEMKEVSRLYANKRGRKVAQRDETDLLAAFKTGGDFRKRLIDIGLLEVMPLC